MKLRRSLALLVLLCCAGLVGRLGAQGEQPARVRDVIYGRKHGVVLTMDVFKPAKPNGIGVLWMVSGGWFSSHGNISAAQAKPFTDKGQTVFAVVHGSQPKYAIQEIVQDIDRATRYVRTHAREYGVDPDRLGIAGGSAGGHLSLMQGARGSAGNPQAMDLVDRASSKVQAVACFFPPTDFINYGETGKNALVQPRLQPFRAAFGLKSDAPAVIESTAKEISPVTFTTKDMPPTLIIHGDADDLVPIQQAQVMLKRLDELSVKNKLVVREGKGHGWPTLGADMSILAEWFEQHLGRKE